MMYLLGRVICLIRLTKVISRKTLDNFATGSCYQVHILSFKFSVVKLALSRVSQTTLEQLLSSVQSHLNRIKAGRSIICCFSDFEPVFNQLDRSNGRAF